MSKPVSIETKGGQTAMVVQVDPNEPPPPQGWKRGNCSIAVQDACLVEDLLVRGLDSGDAVGMFSLAPDVRRQDLSHEQYIAGHRRWLSEGMASVEPGRPSMMRAIGS